MMKKLFAAALFAVLWIVPAAAEDDLMIGDVPLPIDATPTPKGAFPFSGVWTGTWGGQINHIFMVEALQSDGAANVIYAIGENGSGPGRWLRADARIEGDVLTFSGNGFSVRYEISPSGRLRGVFGEGRGFTVLKQHDFGALKVAPKLDWWSLGDLAPLITSLTEEGRPVILNTVIYRPKGKGPFPLAVVHHGSTGDGRDPATADFVWANDWFADVLNARGYLVAFPQRRGRGGSDGLYDEGFAEDRREGYSPETRLSLPGAERALADAEAALATLRKRDDVAEGPIMLGGVSRGGVVALMQAGARPDDVSGVVNFVGGWVSEGWGDETINPALFARGGAFGGPVLSIYAEDDPYYSIPYSKQNLAALAEAGVESRLHVVTVAGSGNGHWAMGYPNLWADAVDAYLDEVTP